jgi:hypothetical protein
MQRWPDGLTSTYRMSWSDLNLDSSLQKFKEFFPYSPCNNNNNQVTGIRLAENLTEENTAAFTFTLSLKVCVVCSFSFLY